MISNFYLLISCYIRNLFDLLHVLSMFFTCNYDIMPTWPMVQKSSRLQVNQKTGDCGNLEFYFSSDQSRLTVIALIWIVSAIYPLKCQSRLQQTTNFGTTFLIKKKIQYDISWESSACIRFSWNIMPFLLFLKKQQNLKLPSAANYRWHFMS